jgi:hypothetical protein
VVQILAIVIGPEQVGNVATESSLYPLLAKVGALSVVGFVLGFGAYVSVHLLPLRVLRRAVAQLEATQASLRDQVTMTQSALATAREKTIVAEEMSRKLEAALEKAELASRTKSEFLSNMSLNCGLRSTPSSASRTG